MSKNVYLTKKAFAYTNKDIEHLISTVEKLSNSKQLASVSEVIDIHTRYRSRNINKIQRVLFGTKVKPYVFVSCLN